MKKIIIYLSVLLISNMYAQCNDYSQTQCSNDNNCEWIEDIETGNCGTLVGDDCELNPECNWNCDSVDDYMGWCTYSCDGGPYEIDNSYCEEIEIPECSEMNEFECSSDNSCDWVDNTETGSCSTLPLSVCDLPEYGSCYSDCTNWGSYYNGMFCYGTMYCAGGSYQLDNNYCQEVQYLLGDITGDFYVNILDIIQIVNLILDNEYTMTVDMNNDNQLNVLDVILVVDIILGN